MNATDYKAPQVSGSLTQQRDYLVASGFCWLARWRLIWRRCSFSKSSSVSLRRNISLTMNSSSNISIGGFLSASKVSYMVGHFFLREGVDFEFRLNFNSTKATLKRIFTPSHKNMSQTRKIVAHGKVLVKTHKNHSVIYNIGSIFCFFKCFNFKRYRRFRRKWLR